MDEMRVYFLKCRRPIGKGAVQTYRDIQVVDSRRVAGREHLEFAIAQAEKAFQRKTNISKDLLIEVLVRASAQHQIKKALEVYGVQASRSVYIVASELPAPLLEEYSCSEAEEEVDRRKYQGLKEHFGITEEEIRAVAGGEFAERLEALGMVIRERIALLEAA